MIFVDVVDDVVLGFVFDEDFDGMIVFEDSDLCLVWIVFDEYFVCDGGWFGLLFGGGFFLIYGGLMFVSWWFSDLCSVDV